MAAQSPVAREKQQRQFDPTPIKTPVSSDKSPAAPTSTAANATAAAPTAVPVIDAPRRKLQLKDPASLKRSAELHRSAGSAPTTTTATMSATAAVTSANASTAAAAAVPSAQDVEFQQNMQRMLEKRAQSQRAVLDSDFKVPLRKATSDDTVAAQRPVGAGPVAVVRMTPPPATYQQQPQQPQLLPQLSSSSSSSVPLPVKGVGAPWKVVPTPAIAAAVPMPPRASAWDCFLAARAPKVAEFLHLPVVSAQVLGVVQQQFIDLPPHERQVYQAMADRRRGHVDAAIAEHDRFCAAYPEAFECPACGLYITEEQFWQHYDWEVARKARTGQLTRVADAAPRVWSEAEQ
jgi:hypothetical protein